MEGKELRKYRQIIHAYAYGKMYGDWKGEGQMPYIAEPLIYDLFPPEKHENVKIALDEMVDRGLFVHMLETETRSAVYVVNVKGFMPREKCKPDYEKTRNIQFDMWKESSLIEGNPPLQRFFENLREH